MKYLKKLEELNSSVWVLTQKVKNIHFNLKGKKFYSLHKLTDELYAELEEQYDELSEKIAMTGEVVKASFTEHVANSKVEDTKGQKWSLESGANAIANDLTTLLGLTKELTEMDIMTLQPVLDEVSMIADKYRWLFKSHTE